MRKLLLSLLLPTSILANAQNITGRWNTVDDETGKVKSVVEINVRNGVASGRIVEIKDPARQTATCTKCTDDRKDRPILGLEIMRGLKEDDGEWSGGTVIDPENGKTYDCRIWVENGQLKMRGYIGFLYRTQTWVR